MLRKSNARKKIQRVTLMRKSITMLPIFIFSSWWYTKDLIFVARVQLSFKISSNSLGMHVQTYNTGIEILIKLKSRVATIWNGNGMCSVIADDGWKVWYSILPRKWDIAYLMSYGMSCNFIYKQSFIGMHWKKHECSGLLW